ncbi:MAG: hypothetical protein NTY19_27010 [Planctomycetota bacterium]|nr:hypothetical protein [Planctomycetota bacterium]
MGQAILYGPSLTGQKILLPLDLLAIPSVYLPITPEVARIAPHNQVRSDLIFVWEPAPSFAIRELRAGRWPLWAPYQYAGAPVTIVPYSPFLLLRACFPSPVTIAWVQAISMAVAGCGCYLFCRHVLRVGFWPATIVAWCFPLTGFMILWQGFPMPLNAAWLPWLLLSVDRAVRQTDRWSGPALALSTVLELVTGQLDVAGQVLLTSGLYAIWCLFDEHHGRWFTRRSVAAISTLVAGWGLGFLLAAPGVLPVLEYAKTGARMMRRSQGEEERPPVGIAALPQIVLPDLLGSNQHGSLRMISGSQLESSAQTYTGLLATLLVAPLAWCSRRHRSLNLFWGVLGLLALGWSLNVPGLVFLLRKPPLNMMSHNRFVFAASFAILAMTAVGLDMLLRGDLRRRGWFWLPVVLLVMLGGWCLYWTFVPPEPIATQLEVLVRQRKTLGLIGDLAAVRLVQASFVRTCAISAVLCGLGIAGWLWLWFRSRLRPWFVPLLGSLLIADLLWFAWGRSAQCDPAWYYPRLPVLEQVASASPGRIIGYQCLPVSLSQTHGLCDIRGYDAVDPARLMDLLAITADPRSARIPYALSQGLIPSMELKPPNVLRLSPILDMLNVRYVIFRGPPPEGIQPEFRGNDYWVLINRAALPRVYVPQRVEVVADAQTRLAKLAAADFNPAHVAFLESPVSLSANCRGSAEIVEEVPTRIRISWQMETPGLIVLSDLWHPGWKAYIDGNPVPILRANHAIRGVIAPPGSGALEFRYEPDSFRDGLHLCELAILILIAWATRNLWCTRLSDNERISPAC